MYNVKIQNRTELTTHLKEIIQKTTILLRINKSECNINKQEHDHVIIKHVLRPLLDPCTLNIFRKKMSL